MANFGWSYPPGCSGTPADEIVGCEVCFREVGDCICPECPICSEAGNPACYVEHGLVHSAEQAASRDAYLSRPDISPDSEPSPDEVAELDRLHCDAFDVNDVAEADIWSR